MISPPDQTLARVGLRAVRWARSRTFAASPQVWLAGALLALSAFVGALVFGVSYLAWLSAIAGIACSVPAMKWRGLKRHRHLPLVVLARFRSENPAYEHIATVHVHQIERRLRQNRLLLEAIDLRVENAPLTEEQARRLMLNVHAAAVVSGSGLTVGAHARWEGWVLTSWPITVVRTQEHHQTGARRMVDPEEVVVVGERDELPPDAEQPLSILTAGIFSAAHAEAIEGALTVNAGAWTYPSELSTALMKAAEETKQILPRHPRVVLELHRVMARLEETGDVTEAVRSLQRVGDEGVDHELLWDTCFMLMAGDPTFDAGARLKVARRGLAANPQHVPALTNVGLTLLRLGRQDEARGHLIAAHERMEPGAPSNLDAVLAAHLYRAGGGVEDWLRWVDVFRTVRAFNQPGVLEQLQLSREDLESSTPPSSFGRLPWS